MLNRLEIYLRNYLYSVYLYNSGIHGIHRYMKEFERLSQSSLSEINETCFRRLREVIKHAYETSPYYHTLWDEIGFYPQIHSMDDIHAIPVLTKEDLQQNRERMISSDIDMDNLELSYTGGSSGTPTSFFRDKKCTSERIGRQWGVLSKCNYYMGEKRGLVWGAHQDLSCGSTPGNIKQAIRKYASAQEVLCCTIFSEDDLYNFYYRLKRFHPPVLYGYPNTMGLFADFIKRKKLDALSFKTIISTAERLTDEQRKNLEASFGGEVFNLYCTREHGCIGFECKEHLGFHIDVGNVYLEVIAEGKIADPGEPGEIVTTDLLNYGMPLIRYKIGDMGMLSTSVCNCGCKLPLLKSLEGRVTDMLYRPDGSTVSGIMLVDMFMDEPQIRKIQIVQKSIYDTILYIVVDGDFNDVMRASAIHRVRGYIGDGVNVQVRQVEDIAGNQISGKYQEVICKIEQ
jgi:phenylacetate-CoA ligase